METTLTIEQLQNVKMMLKFEFAERLGISRRTLSRYCNCLLFDELTKIHYRKSQKHLTHRQMKFIFNELVGGEVAA